MARRCKVAIVGAGTAGLAALAVVRRSTEDFVIVNDGPYGTTCARVGCMPSKALIEVAKRVHHRASFPGMGITGGERLAADVPAVLRRVRGIRDDLVRGVLKLTDGLGERSIAGRARLAGPQALEVNGQRIEAERIILATGSRPVVPKPWQALGERLLTTDGLFEQPDLPRRLAVIGLGAVGAEMAQALARLGLEVNAFDALERVAGLTDPEVNDAVLAVLRADLAGVHLGAPAELAAEGAAVRVRAGGASMLADKVLVALGRRPNLDELGLETLGVALDRRGMPPFDPTTMQIAGMPVFIAGDADGHAPVLHEAADDGWIAGANTLRDAPECYERRTRLGIVFTDPNVAVVGRAFAELVRDEAAIGEARLERQSRLRMSDEDRGVIRVYAERASGRLIGAELFAPGGEHLAHLLALAVQQRLTLAQLLRLPYYHPTLEEALRSALRAAAKQVAGAGGPDLAGCEPPAAAALG
ncbi:MAG: dihydrolipoyl dehydrogenase [Burkholderiales bacterium]|nr:dihydrolipoyl dehydrogenase [Burkholderiales bacterium]